MLYYYGKMLVVFFVGFIVALFFVASWLKRRNQAREALGRAHENKVSEGVLDSSNFLMIDGNGFSGKRRNGGAIEHLRVQVGDSIMYIRVEENSNMSLIFIHKEDCEPYLKEKGISFVFNSQGALCQVDHLLNGRLLKTPQIQNLTDIKL